MIPNHWITKLQQPISIGSLVFFRICFGLIMVWESWRYVRYGWARYNFSDLTVHFPYDWFPWIKPLPGDWVVYTFVFMGLTGLGMALGLFYRLSAALFTVSMTYLFLIDKANYLNHIYLVCILGALMTIIPCHRAFSLDALRKPQIASDTVSCWYLWLLRLQIGLVYFFAGVAKIKYDWLIGGHPMQPWLAEHANTPIIGPLFLLLPTVYLMSWSGMVLDLLIFPALLYKRTRPVAAVFLCLFHLSNAFLFNIGIFPWLMLASITLFFEPVWLDRFKPLWFRSPPREAKSKRPVPAWVRFGVCSLIAAHFAVQIFLPLRHHLIPSDVNWTKEGSRFAWRMKLNRRFGNLRILVETDKSGGLAEVPLESFLNRRQIRKLRVWPDMVHDLAFMLEEELSSQGHKDIKVYAESRISLNGRPEQYLFDPEADLTAHPRKGWLSHQPFLIPLKD